MTETTQVMRAAPPSAAARPRWLALPLLALAQLMLVLDVTVVNVALPDIGSALHLDRATLPWVLTTYTLLFGGLMLLGGRFADLFGARRSVLLGLAVFTAASLLCGVSQSPAVLLTGRALQGVGAAVMSPAALAVVMSIYTGSARAKALAVWSAISGVGSAMGVILGGLLTSAAGWRWIFVINVPIGIGLLVAIPLVAPARAAVTKDGRQLDVPGALLVTTGTAALIYGLINAGSHGWSSLSSFAAGAAAVAAFTALVQVERRTARPLLSIELLARRPSLAGSFLMLVATGLMVGGYFLASFDLQHMHGYSALHVGLAFLPMAVATVVGAQGAGQLLQRINTRLVAVAGLALATAGFTIAALWDAPTIAVTGLSVAALGIGATFVTAFTASLTDAPQVEAGLRSALVNTFHELGGAAGVAVLSTVAGTALVSAAPGADAFRGAFTVAAGIAAIGVIVAAVLVPAMLRKPAAVSAGD
jgi:EmrB/QacA subfamily drug resistance transporter